MNNQSNADVNKQVESGIYVLSGRGAWIPRHDFVETCQEDVHHNVAFLDERHFRQFVDDLLGKGQTVHTTLKKHKMSGVETLLEYNQILKLVFLPPNVKSIQIIRRKRK